MHYELSLFAALGREEYEKLGQRQSHFSDNEDLKKIIPDIFDFWRAHLLDQNMFDPMVTGLPADFLSLWSLMCGDEIQNLPPIAIHSLIKLLKGQVILSLDPNQCLLSSPYIAQFLKQQLHIYYQKQQDEGHYDFNKPTELYLTLTHRNTQGVIHSFNKLLEAIRSIDSYQ